MNWSLTGPPEEAKSYAEATSTADFYHILNGNRLSYAHFVAAIEQYRGKVSNHEIVV